MRQRLERRLHKALRIAAAFEPELARRCLRARHPVAVLQRIVASPADAAPLRLAAASLLHLTGAPRPFDPLFSILLGPDSLQAMHLAVHLPQPARRLPATAESAFRAAVRSNPDPRCRRAVIVFLRYARAPFARPLLMEVLADSQETPELRGEAAEALIHHADAATFHLLLSLLSHPHPELRFWAVFAVGTMADSHPSWNSEARAALRPLLKDTSAGPPGFWSVGLEARAMLKNLGEPCGPPPTVTPDETARWQQFYDPAAPPDHAAPQLIWARYRGLSWSRSLAQSPAKPPTA